MSERQRKRVLWLVGQMACCVWVIAVGVVIGEAHAANSRQAADAFGAVVRWVAVERALTARVHTCAGGTACLTGSVP